MSKWSMFRDRVGGKWQFPLLLASLVLLAASIYRAAPKPVRLPLAEAITQLESLVQSGVHDHALELGEVLLSRDDCADPDAATIRRLLARSRFAQASRRSAGSVSAGKYVVEQYLAAQRGGAELNAADHCNLARALEWQNQTSAAVEHYRQALTLGLDDPWDVRRHLIETTRERLNAPPDEVRLELDAFLKDVPDSRLDLRLWAIEEQLAVLDETGRLDDAAGLFSADEHRFRESDLRDRFEYLDALRLFKAGQFDRCALALRGLRSRTAPESDLHAMSGWLLGRALLGGDAPRPLEAISFFEDVLRYHPGGPYAVASRVGLGEALATLDRHDEASAAYQTALGDLGSLGDQRVVSRSALALSLAVVAEAQRQAGHLESALNYARMAMQLVDRQRLDQASAVLRQFAETAGRLAEEREDATGRRGLFSEAGEAYLEIARLNTLNDRLFAEASWQAAESYALAGDTARASELFERYTIDRPNDPLVPRAKLRIGQLNHEARRIRAAIAAYQECYRRFPRTLDGARALVPLARCYLTLGPDQLELAEKTLQLILDDSAVFTPEAPEFADALFLLGEVLSRRGHFERAITTMQEAVDRYPHDPRRSRTQFLLADAYRRSGLALRDGSGNAAPSERLREESAARVATARDLFRHVVEDLEPAEHDGDALNKMYLRHARFYEADCLFEMQDYRGALSLYEEAAGTYRDVASGLAAYVQMINCHVFLGRPEEARATLARAMVLVEAMPQVAFDRGVSSQTRGDWKEYFVWLGASGLF